MSDSSLQVGDRVRYVERLISGVKRRGQVGTITNTFPDGTSGPLGADIEFDDASSKALALLCSNSHSRGKTIVSYGAQFVLISPRSIE